MEVCWLVWSYISEEGNPDNESDTEFIFVKISFQSNKSIIVGSIIVHPIVIWHAWNIKQQGDKLNKKSKGAVFWIGDDINLPVIQWTTQTITIQHRLI